MQLTSFTRHLGVTWARAIDATETPGLPALAAGRPLRYPCRMKAPDERTPAGPTSELDGADQPGRLGRLERQDLDLDELRAMSEAYDATVLSTPGIDHFCSSSTWILPAHSAFHADDEVIAARLGDGFLALTRGQAPGLGPFLAPLEAMWGLACPLVGARPTPLARAAADLVSTLSDWRLLWLSGLLRDGPLFTSLARALSRYELRLGPITQRFRASLDGGFDGWLGRRSPLFRKRLRASLRLAERDLDFEWLTAPVSSRTEAQSLFSRIHAVETRSWKGLDGTGFVAGDMRRFYELMVPELAAAGRLRVLFARQDGQDVGVCFGGVLAHAYRGLQNSFDDRFRDRSLGNVLQAETIRRLCDEAITTYDLGSGMDYKARWAEEIFETTALLVLRR